MGVPYGFAIDKDRLLQCLTTGKDDEGIRRIMLTEKGASLAELFHSARLLMFSQVYWHAAVRSPIVMLRNAAREFVGRSKTKRAAFRANVLAASDEEVARWLQDRGSHCGLLGTWMRKRRLFKAVITLRHPAALPGVQPTQESRLHEVLTQSRKRLGEISDSLATKLSKALGERVPRYMIGIDVPNAEKYLAGDLYIRIKGKPTEISEIPSGLMNLNTQVGWLAHPRVYAEPELARHLRSRFAEEKRAELVQLIMEAAEAIS